MIIECGENLMNEPIRIHEAVTFWLQSKEMLRPLNMLDENVITVNTICPHPNKIRLLIQVSATWMSYSLPLCSHAEFTKLLSEMFLVRRNESIRHICYLVYAIPNFTFHRLQRDYLLCHGHVIMTEKNTVPSFRTSFRIPKSFVKQALRQSIEWHKKQKDR